MLDTYFYDAILTKEAFSFWVNKTKTSIEVLWVIGRGQRMADGILQGMIAKSSSVEMSGTKIKILVRTTRTADLIIAQYMEVYFDGTLSTLSVVGFSDKPAEK